MKVLLRMFLIGILFFVSFLCVQTVLAEDVSVDPERIFISGDLGETITDSITITNHNLSEDYTVVIIEEVLGLTIIPESITVDANESVVLGVFYTFQQSIVSGNITFDFNGLDLLVNLTIDELGQEGDGDGEASDIGIGFLPNPPQSGGTIAIYFTGKNNSLSASGFLYCNGFVYNVDMEKGFGVVDVDQNAFGQATLYLFGKDLQESYVTTVFSIEKGTGKSLMVNVPETATIDDEITAVVTYGGTVYTGHDVTVESPDETVETFITDNNGKIYFDVWDEGRWKIIATGEGQIATGIINVEYGHLALSLVEDIDTEPLEVGDVVTIVTEEGAYIEVFIDGEQIADYTAPSDGFISLSLLQGGNYALKGQMESKRGDFSFYVPPQAQIKLFDFETRLPVEKVEKQKKYIVEITDSKGNLLNEMEEAEINNPIGTKEILPLEDGKGTWFPLISGSFMLSVDETSKTAGTSKHVIVYEPGLPAAEATVVVLLGVILVFMALLFVYSKKKKLPFDLILKSIIHPFKKKKKIELPVG